MPNYFYVAKSFDGETKTGAINAADERQIADILKDQNLILIKAVSREKKSGVRFRFPFFFGRVSLPDKIMVARNMEVMFSAGLSLVKTLDILSGQAKNKKLKNILSEIKERINKGEMLSDALTSYPAVFSEFFVNMVKVGEESGTMEDVLRILSSHLNKEHELKSKIRKAMAYPILILAVMMVVGGVVITFVLPSLNIFFSTLSLEIPVYTKILLTAGNFLSKHWYLLFVAPLSLVVSLWLIMKTKRGKKAIDGFLLKLPIISPIVKKNNSALLVRSLSSLIAAGVALTRSLEISSKVVGNYYFQIAADEASQKIKKGEKLSSALKSHHGIFPYGVVEMIEVGEETGKTSEILQKLADFYEQEAVNAVEKLTTLIEPALIVFLGLSAGFFAFSVIQPIYSSLQVIK